MPAIHPTVIPIVERLVAGYQPQKVILFGSYACDRQGEESDIDLLIIKETSERFIDRWSAVQRILTDSKRKVGVDTLVMTPEEVESRLHRGDHFIEDILAHGVELYAS